MKRSRLLSSALAIAATVGILFGSTLAWQSVSQTALNEVSASVNPGGRLHDDFNDITAATGARTMSYDKDVYVENFTELAANGVQLFARVRLDEYMELGEGAGIQNADGSASPQNSAVSLVPGATLTDKATWTTHKWGDTGAFHDYWDWDMGGETVYMPTFDRNKDSKAADINGTSADQFATHQDYAVGDTRTANAIYDVDAAEDGAPETDELLENGIDAADVISGAYSLPNNSYWSTHVQVKEETHTAQKTKNGTIVPMATYMQWLNEDPDFSGVGDFWVYDEDGWAYWASPIDPETATGLLLSGISRTERIINQDWYYAINVVAQVVTGDDLGQADGSGFYDLTEGSAPTAEALLLLNAIGVEVSFTAGTEAELAEALAHGGNITLTGDIALTEQLTVSADTVLELDGHTLSGSGIYNGDEAVKSWSLLSVRDATLILSGGTLAAEKDDSYCVDVRDGGRLIVNGGTFQGNISAVYVRQGEAVINGGSFSVQQTASGDKPYGYVVNCYHEAYLDGSAKVTVCGGSFTGFDPSDIAAAGDGCFVPAGYTVTESGGVYTVTKTPAAGEAGSNTGD